MSSEILELNTKAQRNLKRNKLARSYTEEELNELVKIYSYPSNPDVSQIRWTDKFNELREAGNSCSPRKIRKWSPEEDKFLRNTYMYLTDTTIALALNIPSNIVLARRKYLGLRKKQVNDLEVMVWCERDNFEEDLRKTTLLKARPDVVL